jgi:polyferredoxin
VSFSAESYVLLADLIVALHAGVVLYVVVGQILIIAGWIKDWVWPRNLAFRLTHLGAIAFVVMESWLGIICPLTTLENHFRKLSGNEVYQMSFIGYWLNELLFYNLPEWVFVLVYSLFFLLVVAMFIAYPPRQRRQ